MSMPNLYRDPYFSLLDSYCASMRTANKDLDKSKREIPTTCNYRLDQKLEAVTTAKKAVERSQDWRDWAAVTCWPDQSDRNAALLTPDANGAVCTEPKLPKSLPQSHTRVAGLVVVTEVIPGSKAAKFLGDALAASSADVSKVIVDKLSKATAARMKRQAAWYVANNAYRAAGRNPPYPEGSP